MVVLTEILIENNQWMIPRICCRFRFTTEQERHYFSYLFIFNLAIPRMIRAGFF